ncbi:MAG: hypothetical protein U9O64_02005 [Campylobacterota bacterium]|nr:hypothetical protein [Campylobacterota bacterium]
MKRVKRALLFISLLMVLSEATNATTIFARQYNMTCGACHIGVPPTLNATGEQFLRNGMRFSQSDTTTLQRFLAKEESLIPFGMFAGIGRMNMEAKLQTKQGSVTQSNDVHNPIVTFFLAGSLSEHFSIFLGSQYVYAQKTQQDKTKEFRRNRSKAYLQYNHGSEQIVRGGIIYLYPETSRNSGLSSIPNLFISPLDRGITKPLHGAEYAYYTENGWKFLVAAGVMGDANSEQSMLTQIEYLADNYSLSLIANNITETRDETQIANYTPEEITFGERFSLMMPLEYQFDYGYLNVTGLYENNKRVSTGEYFGIESSFTVPIFESANLRYIYTQDNEEGVGHSFRYAHIIDNKLFVNVNYASVDTPKGSFDTFVVGVNFIY